MVANYIDAMGQIIFFELHLTIKYIIYIVVLSENMYY